MVRACNRGPSKPAAPPPWAAPSNQAVLMTRALCRRPAVARTYSRPNRSRKAVGNGSHSFVRSADGVITAIDIPGASNTLAYSINDARDLTGDYLDTNDVAHGFVRGPGGSITTFDAPGAGTSFGLGTLPIGISGTGEIVGSYIDAQQIRYGFVRDANGVITTFSPPGSQNISAATQVYGINKAGAVVVSYYFPANLPRTFIRGANGVITTFADPSAGRGTKQGTTGFGMNDAGAVTGYYIDRSYVRHGFLLTR